MKFMAITKIELSAANRRGREARAAGPVAQAARYDGRAKRLIVNIGTGVDLVFDPKRLQGLENATMIGLKRVEISPSGLGLHFPLLNADIYLPALLEGVLGSQKWIAAEMGRRGGSVTSKVKALASRENGKLGGRPRRKVS
jgi:hypothetical protein